MSRLLRIDRVDLVSEEDDVLECLGVRTHPAIHLSAVLHHDGHIAFAAADSFFVGAATGSRHAGY
jgi:hypothetical protein